LRNLVFFRLELSHQPRDPLHFKTIPSSVQKTLVSHLKMTSTSLPPLAVLLPVFLAIWAVSCLLVHGSAIIGYLGIQIATSGVFALAMTRAAKRE
jgi:hypothetical protein